MSLAFDSPAAARSFLGVERSASGRRWVDRLDMRGSAIATDMAQRHGLPELLARILAGRDVAVDAAAEFLDPTLRRLMPDPSSLVDMDAGAARIAEAIQRRQRVAIFGDYDVDGATSSALMARYLRALGLDPVIYIPDRLFEGYGPNREAIDQLAGEGAELIVAVDCGTTSFDALEQAKARGVDVVVIDHHLAGTELPPALAIVNPNRQDDLSGLGHLAAVGLVFMAIVAINRELRRRGAFAAGLTEPDLLQWLDLVALGTVCDVVGLRGLNRAFVTKGLAALRRQENSGLAALIRSARLDGPVAAHHLGFLLGPRINAGGRIGDAALGARLLTTDDAVEAERIAGELERLNGERQAIEAAMLAEALAAAEPLFGRDAAAAPPVIVTHSPDWHPGIVGLIAARLKERFGRPAFAVAVTPAGGLGVGSARSIAGVDLGRAVRQAVEAGLLVKGGGHAMAAGITIDLARLPEFEAFIAEALQDQVRRAEAEERCLVVDATLTARGATLDLVGLLERAGPFGAGHAEPVMAFPSHVASYAEVVGNGHVRVAVTSGEGPPLKGMAFRAAGTPLGDLLLSRDRRTLHIAGTLSADHWRGTSRPSLRILDAAEPRD